MKKILLSSLFVLLGTLSFAQTTKGTTSFSGSVGLSIDNSKNKKSNWSSKNRSYTLEPSVGYFIADNLELGVTAGYKYSSWKAHSNYSNHYGGHSSSISDNKEERYSAGAYLKKYFMVIDKFAFTGLTNISYSIGSTENTSNSRYVDEAGNESGSGSYSNYETDWVGILISPGIAFFPTEKISLSASFGSVGYTHTINKYKQGYMHELENTESTNNGFNLNLYSSSMMFGLSYYLNH